MKKILCDFQSLGGGAPLSHLEHAKALERLGFEVIVIISNNETDFFKETNFKIFRLKSFREVAGLSKFLLFNDYLKIIKNENIDVIYANRVMQCLYLSILSDLTGVPIINARAGGYLTSSNIDLIKLQKSKPYILYSQENIKDFIEAGFNRDQLFLISNRLPNPEFTETTDNIPNNNLMITITGNIKDDTVSGLIWIINIICSNIDSCRYNIIINIAGENQLNSGRYNSLFKNTVEKINSLNTSKVYINILGWVENISHIQKKSHICVGKGRSIIEPAMMGKICFVLSEKQRLYRCKDDNYAFLKYYNFSGRGHGYDDGIQEFIELIKGDKSLYLRHLNQSIILSEKFKKDYSNLYLEEKLKYVFSKIENQITNKLRGLYAIIMVITKKMIVSD